MLKWLGQINFKHLWDLSNRYESESESPSVVSDSLRPQELYSPWNSPGQNIGVGSLSLLQGLFPIQGLNPGLLHCRWIFYQLRQYFFRACYVPSTVLGAGDSLAPALKDLTGKITRALWEQREGHLTRCEDWGSLSGGRGNWAEILGRNWPLEKQESLGREEHSLDRKSREKKVLRACETEEFRLAGSRG